ncbi:hypothetical protein ACVWWP_004476 [Bradyrhizobium sp. LM3.6]
MAGLPLVWAGRPAAPQRSPREARYCCFEQRLRSTTQAARPERQRGSRHGGHDNVTWGIPDAGSYRRPMTTSIASGRAAALPWVVRKTEAARVPGRLSPYRRRRRIHPPRATPRARRGGREWRARHAAANRVTRPPAPDNTARRRHQCAAAAPFWSLRPPRSLGLWQMTAAESGLAMAWPAAKQAAIGASTCIAKASRTRGKNFCSRARIRRTIRSSTN